MQFSDSNVMMDEVTGVLYIQEGIPIAEELVVQIQNKDYVQKFLELEIQPIQVPVIIKLCGDE